MMMVDVSVEYEVPSDGGFVMEVNLIDCNLEPELRDKIFEYMKSEKVLLDYLKKILPSAKIQKVVRKRPSQTLQEANLR
jgi:hypothetical protein